MIEKEYKLACEVEKLKKEIKQKDNKIKDLEAQKNICKQNEDTERATFNMSNLFIFVIWFKMVMHPNTSEKFY